MTIAGKPLDEEQRLAALRRLGILDTPTDERFDRLTRLAARLLKVPIVAVSLVDEDRQWFKSIQGLDIRETSRDIAFCAHAILGDDTFVVRDAEKDDRFSGNPLVTGDPNIRAYAGQPLIASGGSKIGTLCAIDRKAREWTEDELQVLRDLAALTERELAASVPIRLSAWHYAFPALIAIAGLLLTMTLFQRERASETEDISQKFEAAAIERGKRIEEYLVNGLDEVHSLAGFFSANENVTSHAFRIFANQISSHRSEIQALDWLPVISNRDRASFETARRREIPEYQIYNFGDNNERIPTPVGENTIPIALIEPLEKNRSALGLNFFADPVRRRAIDRSIVTARPAVTPPLQLAQKGLGLLVIAPVWKGKIPPRAEERDLSAVKGFVLCAYRLSAVVEHAIANSSKESFESRIFEDSASEPAYAVSAEGQTTTTGINHVFRFMVADRTWRIESRPNEIFLRGISRSGSRAILGTGLVLTFLMTALAYVLVHRRAGIERIVARRTEELAQEVSIRRHTEESLLKTSLLQRAILDSANYSIISTDVNGLIKTFNPAAERWLGYSAAEMIDKATPAVFHDFDEVVQRSLLLTEKLGRTIEPGFGTFTAECRDGRVDEREWTYVRKDKTRFPVYLSISALKESNGDIAGFLGVAFDLTERKKADDALRESELRNRAVLDNTVEAIITISSGGIIENANPATERLFGYSVAELVGRNIKMLMPDPYHREHDGYLANYLRTGKARIIGKGRDVTALRKDGTELPLELGVSEIHLGERRLFTGILRDISARRRAEAEINAAREAAEQASQAKSDFLANMSHELRTPLNSVIGFASLLLKNKAGNFASQDITYLGRIVENGKHLLALINSVLDVSKIEAGRMEVTLTDVNLPDLVRETLAMLESRVDSSKVSLRSEFPEDLLPVQSDAAKLRQVLINLVGNSLKFTTDGNVTVRVGANADGFPVRIDVSDTGIGIPEDRQQTIFEAFRQADNSTSRQFGGTGLGLTISRQLCTLMGYDLIVKSILGEGSTFSIVIPEQLSASPAFQLPEAGDVEQSGGHSDLSGKTVLIVDDQADSRVLISEVFRDSGMRILQAGSGAQALEAMRLDKPDIVTLDLMMPRMSGGEVLKAIRADPELRNIPVVVVSNVASEGRSMNLGTVDLVDKPVDREELLAAVRRNLGIGSRRVLIVEDDPDMRELLREYVSDVAGETVLAENGRRGLDELESFRPDVILLDLMMPEMDGWEMLEALRRDPRHASIPVVIVTAGDLGDSAQENLVKKVSGVLRKEGDFERELRGIVGSILCGRGAEIV